MASSLDVTTLTVGPLQENCFVVRRDAQATSAVVIDPGDEAQRIVATLDALGVSVEAILLTHTHFDHVGAVAALARHTGAPVHCPRGEAHILADIDGHMRMPGFGPFESYAADALLDGGDHLTLADLEIDVHASPGHSIDHVAFSIPAEGALLSGDVLFDGSIGRTDLPGGDLPTLLASIARLLAALPDETIVLPGHMGATTLGRERASNPFLQSLPAAS